MTPEEMAKLAVRALDAKRGEKIELLRVRDLTILADYFLICTGTSNTHVRTLCDEVEKALREHDEPLLRREGQRGGTWVLLDFGCLVVHVFTDETRKFYDLERLWSDAEETDISALLIAEN